MYQVEDMIGTSLPWVRSSTSSGRWRGRTCLS
jgi:hypothetical protein